MTTEAGKQHPVYPDGPDCQPNCPGPHSSYHDGYADGYENAENAERARIGLAVEAALVHLDVEFSRWSKDKAHGIRIARAAVLAIVNGKSTANNDKVSREGAERPPSCVQHPEDY